MVVAIVVPIAVFVLLFLVVDQFRRLVGQAVLNGTIRKALDKDPASVPLLIEKLETRNPMPISLVGWVFLVLGALSLGALGMTGSRDAEEWAGGVLPLGIGAAILGWDWLNRKRLPAERRKSELPPVDRSEAADS